MFPKHVTHKSLYLNSGTQIGSQVGEERGVWISGFLKGTMTVANWSQGSVFIVRGREKGGKGPGMNWTCGGGAAVQKKTEGQRREDEEWGRMEHRPGPVPEK